MSKAHPHSITTAEELRDRVGDVKERLAVRGRPAILATHVRIDECFFHCAKAFIRSNLRKPKKWAERHRVSFGEIYAAGNAGAVREINEAIEEDYRENL